MPSNESPRILITRLSAIGDCILTLPVACAIRDSFPNAFLAWTVEPAAASLLEGHAAIDELIVVRKGWLKSPASLWDLRQRLRRLRFDAVIDPQSLSKSAILGWLSGARQRVGFAAPQGRELSLMLNNCRVSNRSQHLVDRQLELLEALGIRQPGVRFDVPRREAAEAKVMAWLESQSLSRFAAINPGAGWDSRLWPADRYAAVAEHLAREYGLRSVVVWAGDRERGWAESIVARSNGQTLIAPPTTLSELASMLRSASLFIGSDTGPMHLAAAVGTPCVALHGPTRPEVSGPYGEGHRAVQAYYQSGTSRQRRSAQNEAMQSISTAEVCQACDAVLEGNHRPPLRIAG